MLLIQDNLAEIIHKQFASITVPAALAVVSVESSFQQFFNPKSGLLVDNLKVASRASGLSIAEIEELLNTSGGIPTFRFSQMDWNDQQKGWSSPGTKLLFCCSYGLAQQKGRYLKASAGAASVQDIQNLKKFWMDQNAQLTKLCQQLDPLMKSNKPALAFSKYNLPITKVVTDYGKLVYLTYQEYLKKLPNK
jgi:hypothetical protein